MRPLPAVLLTLVTPWSLVGQAYTISTFAGGGLPGNIPGTSASLYGPQAIAVDGAGNVFVADGGDVLRLDAAKGVLTVVAGNGTAGFGGDDGLATSAQLGARGVAVDSAGNLFIADARNNRVRKISNGVITTVAGSGTKGYSGDNGPATNAQLYSPLGVAVDSGGSLYIADAGNYCVRKVSNGVITTVAGNGRYGYSGDNGPATSAQFAAPDAVAVDPDGNLYIADVSNNRIRKVSNGVVTTVAGNGTAGFSGDGGPATSARFEYPSGVALDSAGNLYIADCDNNRIRKVSNGVITTVAGNGAQGYSGDNGPATGAHLVCPGAVAVDSSGSLYIADTLNFRIRKVSAGLITTVAGNGTPGFSGDNGPATSAQLSAPQGGMAVDSAGSLYFADTGNNRIRKILNGVITTVAGSGTEGYSGDNGPATNAQLYSPLGVAVDSAGNLYIADNSNARIRKVSNGVITTVAGNGTFGYGGDGGPATGAELQQPWGVAVDAAGSLYIADTDNARIRKVSNGVITTVAGNGTHGYGGDYGPATSAQLGSPYGVAVDPVGSLYIADTYCNCIREVSNGVITTVAGNGTAGFSGDGGPATRAELQQPWGVAVDAAGSLYIADLDNLRIRKVSSGVITTVAGGGDQFGDNGPATGAQLAGAGVAVDSAGNVYIADNGNNRIRLLTPGTPPAIFSGGVVPVYGSLPAIEPGSWVSIYGSNLASGTSVWNLDFPMSLGGTSVTIDGKQAFLWYVSPTQINLQAPDDAATGPVSVAVTTGSGTAASTVTLAAYGPSFSLLGDGKHVAGEIMTPDGTGAYGGRTYDLVGPSNTFSYSTRPVKAGETLILYGVGFGPTTPHVPAGQSFSGAASTSSPVTITIGGVPAGVQFSGIAEAGLYQFNLTVPPGTGSGDQTLQATVNGVQTSPGPVVSVQ